MKKVFAIEEFCLACHLCEYNCAFSHSGMKDMVKAYKSGFQPARIQVEESGEINFALNCRHCSDPVCMKACITGSISRGEDGVIRVDTNKCVGCWTCVMTCPYGAVVRGRGDRKVALKCDLCTESGNTPACVEGCPNRALVFEERGDD
ncbi:MAG: 4Fe-4S dicluster domain-containing protein [Clostridia bacterium]|nr:4Fe-4S dicluster domain-containing protein [Clostridia bacterium]MDR3645107.1 4Fe-4S dicluster domain-containing protein [Clostridia bacterium]